MHDRITVGETPAASTTSSQAAQPLWTKPKPIKKAPAPSLADGEPGPPSSDLAPPRPTTPVSTVSKHPHGGPTPLSSPSKARPPKRSRPSLASMTEEELTAIEAMEMDLDPGADDEEEEGEDSQPPTAMEEQRAATSEEQPGSTSRDDANDAPEDDMDTSEDMPTSASTAFDVPEDAPEWITANLAVINKPELGDKYCAAITAWLALEKKWKYDVNKGGSAKGTGRPEALERWIKAGRGSRVKKIPIVLDVPSFEAEVWAWWSSIQPEWRQTDANGRPCEDREAELDADWGLLGIHGQGGMLHPVAIACWWGVALEGRTSHSWERFVADMTWVCQKQVYA